MDSSADGPQEVLTYMSNEGFTVGSITYSVGNDQDDLAYLSKISAPRRAGGDKLLTTWLVDIEYEFNLDNLPRIRPVRIEPYFIEGTEPIESAVHFGAFNRVNEQWVQVQLQKATYQRGKRFPVGNSSEVPILPAPERPTLKPAYRVSWTKASAFSDAAFYAGTWNANPFTLRTVSRVYLAPGLAFDVPFFNKTFPEKTLRLSSVQQPIRTIYNRDWYEVTLEFVEEEFLLYEIDRGVTARAKAGDPDGKGGTFSEGDFPEGSVGQRALLDASGQPITDPVLLNGEGKPLRDLAQSLPPVYLAWAKGEITDFNGIGIGNPN
jgi:hypothetical protein